MVELLIVVLIILIVAGIAIPGFISIRETLRLSGDARNLYSLLGQAKMRASAQFTYARVRMGVNNNNYRLEQWNTTTNQWQTVGGIQTFATGVGAGYGLAATPPPNALTPQQQAPVCRTDNPAIPFVGSLDPNGDVCIEFNSRGEPVLYTTPLYVSASPDLALYITNSAGTYALTVSGTAITKMWSYSGNNGPWIIR